MDKELDNTTVFYVSKIVKDISPLVTKGIFQSDESAEFTGQLFSVVVQPSSNLQGAYAKDVSDERGKNISPLPGSIVKAISELEAIEFTWKDGDDTESKHIGFGAQSVRYIFAQHGLDPDDYYALQYDHKADAYSMAYMEFIPMVLAYTQSLESRIEAIESKLSS